MTTSSAPYAIELLRANPPMVCDAHDLSVLLGLDVAEIEDLLQRGEIPGRRVAGRWLSVWEDVIAVLRVETDRLDSARGRA